MSHESHSSSLPRFSVIVAVYNGARTLQRALDSVFEQTHVGVELIVIDGASTHGTRRSSSATRRASRIGSRSPIEASTTLGTRPWIT